MPQINAGKPRLPIGETRNRTACGGYVVRRIAHRTWPRCLLGRAAIYWRGDHSELDRSRSTKARCNNSNLRLCAHEPRDFVGRRTQMTDRITIVLADDHAIVRRGLRQLLESQDGFEVLAEAEDVDAARRYVRGHHPNVLVLDLNMPGEASIDAIPGLREEFPDTQIVVLTMQNEPAYARAALSAGVLGYVLKESADTELVEAIRAAVAGHSYLNPRLGARVAVEPASGPPDGLSDRELGVLRLIALGNTNGQIADALFLSVRTVETHRAHIQQKLGLADRAELVRYALDHKLL